MMLRTRYLFTLISFSILFSGCSYLPHKTAEITPESAPPTTPPSEPVIQRLPGQNQDGSYNNLWSRVRNGYALPAVSDTKISKDLQWYSQNQRFLTRATTQSQPYLHYVVSQMEENGIPLEFALIPIIESAYDPTVTSPSNNVGLWQFAPQTGKNFGLKQNKLYNGRRDAIASTDAVISYFKKLAKMFDNDWLLVIAAYNSGEGTIGNAIEKNKRLGKPVDFWSLPLPKHTHEYIPKLIALSRIVADPQRYNLTIAPIPDTPYFVEVKLPTQINILQAAQHADIDVNILKKLNSGLSTAFTDPNIFRSLLVPVADADAFTLKLASLPQLDTSAVQELQKNNTQEHNQKQAIYKVKTGDNLWSIAKAHKISVQKLMHLNNLVATSIVKVGQTLRVG